MRYAKSDSVLGLGISLLLPRTNPEGVITGPHQRNAICVGRAQDRGGGAYAPETPIQNTWGFTQKKNDKKFPLQRSNACFWYCEWIDPRPFLARQVMNMYVKMEAQSGSPPPKLTPPCWPTPLRLCLGAFVLGQLSQSEDDTWRKNDCNYFSFSRSWWYMIQYHIIFGITYYNFFIFFHRVVI